MDSSIISNLLKVPKPKTVNKYCSYCSRQKRRATYHVVETFDVVKSGYFKMPQGFIHRFKYGGSMISQRTRHCHVDKILVPSSVIWETASIFPVTVLKFKEAFSLFLQVQSILNMRRMSAFDYLLVD